MPNIKNKIIYIFFGAFILLNLFFLVNYNSIIWDEASYISIGKYLFSSGKSGLNEVLRPIILPFLIGILWKLGFNAIIASKILVVLFSVGVIFLTYKIGEMMFGKKEGLIAAFLVTITPIFLEYSSKILTGIPSLFFAMLSLYLILNKKFGLSGFFAGICFLTRFPQILFFVGVFSLLSLNFIKKPNLKKFKNILKFGISFLIVFVVYSVFNYFFYINYTSSWMHAAFRPFYYLFWNYKYVINLGSYNLPFYYYFVELFFSNPLLIFFYFIGLYYIIKNKHKKSIYVLILSFLFFIVFSYLSNKQIRHAIIMLPYIALISAKGISSLRKNLAFVFVKKYYYYFLIIVVLIFTGFSILHLNFDKTTPNMISQYYGFLNQYPVNGNIFITDPLIGAYYDYPVDAAYHDLSSALDKNLKIKRYDLIFYSERSFPCIESDLVCLEKRKDIMQFLLINYNLVFEKNYYGSEYYIFSGVDYIEKIPKTELMMDYGLSQKVSLSKKPYDTLPILIILEDFPSLDSNLSEIWEEEKYLNLMNYIINLNVSVSADIIPVHLQHLKETDIDILKKTKFKFIQNGYSHNETYKRSYDEEYQLIKKGKKIILDLLNENVSAFTSPYYFSTKEKIAVLNDLNFDIYITSSGDSISVPFNRYDQTMTFIKSWEAKKIKNYEEIKKEIEIVENFQDYLLVSVYYYMFEDLSIFEDFINLTKNNIYMNIYEYDDWYVFMNNIKFMEENNQIDLFGEESNMSEMTTLMFFNDGNYTLNTNLKKINIKNKDNENKIKLCINKNCNDLYPNEIVVLNI